jgi:uncharacterized beta-barrel protein YwiB (DUF1934 family)
VQDVVISIKGRQIMSDWDYDEVVELITPGKLQTLAGGYLITYKESRLTGMDGTETVLKVEPKRVTMTRTGGVFSEMVFEQGRRHLSYYDMGVEGGLAIGVNARRVSSDLSELGGMIDLEYAVEIENKLSGHNKMEIEVKQVSQ